jgi:hypothetical protein
MATPRPVLLPEGPQPARPRPARPPAPPRPRTTLQGTRDQPPLSHHQILAQVGPFSRRGLKLDLAASDRLQRLLAFEPRAHAAVVVDGVTTVPALHETLHLDLANPNRPALVRELIGPDGLSARLELTGGEPEALLACLAEVPASRQWRCDGGALMALNHWLDVADVRGAGSSSGLNALRLREATARLAGVTLELRLTSVGGYPADVELTPDAGRTLALPTDLLAVQGRAWSRLSAAQRSWRGHVAVRGEGERRTRHAEDLMARAVVHLQRTLHEPPPRFHARHWRARWGVSLRELGPMAIGIGVVALAFGLRSEGESQSSVLALMANVAPPLLMMLFFVRREMPYIGLPRVPRRPAPDAWPAG